MPAELTNSPEPEFWQSVEEWMDGQPFRDLMKDEFPEDAAEWLDPVSRRKFLALSAASVALASGCNPSLKPASQRKVVPYVRQPEYVTPGVPLFFATAMPQHGGVGLGLIVKQAEGRPIKVEGNPQHPGSLGGCNLTALASALDLYDPDRSKAPVTGDARVGTTFEKTVAAVKSFLASKPAAYAGEGIRLVTEPTTSPTQVALIEKFLERFPKAKWVRYEAVSRDNVRKAAVAAFGVNRNAVYDFTAADVVLALDADFLSTGPGAERYARDFSKRRRTRTGKAALDAKDGVKPDDLSRLYAVEGMVTSTGAVADHRLPLKPSQVEAFARAVAKQLGVNVAAGGELPELAQKWVKPVADDLLAKAKRAVVVVGEHQSAATHLIAHAINEKLGAFESGVVKLTPAIDPQPAKPALGWPTDDQAADLKALVEDMTSGKVDCLLLSGVNPVYDAPADLEFAKAIDTVRKQKNSVVLHHGLYQDETAEKANWHLNAAHYLEAWGDVRGYDGTVSVTQPLVAPLYGGKSLVEFLATLLDQPATDGLGLVQATQQAAFAAAKKSGAFERYWEEGLKSGVLADTAFAAEKAAKPVSLEKVNDAAFKTDPIKDLEIQFRPCPALFDGRQANNGWLQELPKPITNLTWGNAAMVSPRTGEELKVREGYDYFWSTYKAGERGTTETDMIEVEVGGRKLAVPVHVLPGMADGVVVLHLGHGRSRAGRVASPTDDEHPGFDAYKLRGTDSLWTAAVAKPARTGRRHFLAIAGAYHAMESRRPVRYGTVAQFKVDDEFAQVPPVSPGESHEIRQLTPGTPENYRLYGRTQPHDPHKPHTHADGTVHDEGEGHKPHDKRMVPLSLYVPNPIRVTPPNGQPKDDATKTYRRWAMAIDLGSCTGCAACTLACQAENNIPVVGKEQVHRGRAMHWIRIDRYFSIPGRKVMDDDLGDTRVKQAERAERVKKSEAIKVHVQPVPCQQCEKAPCEVVCPVGATVHSADGLNDMAYNRCVGTRYCSNNCPYKVRRFNFLQFTDYTTDSLKLLNNPEVTVRTRGVMEKCTYCVQRIRNAEIEAEREWKARTANPATTDATGRPKILDGEVVTACQQACPTQSIHFGDMNDADAGILRWKAEPHTYGMLAELNTMPRTTYMAAIRNPNTKLDEALAAGKGA